MAETILNSTRSSGTSHRRTRNAKGRFVAVNPGCNDTLIQKRNRQRNYVARQATRKKQLMTSFVNALIVRNAGEQHWIPAQVENSILYELLERIISDSYLDSRRGMHLVAKHMFKVDNPNLPKNRLPRRSVVDYDDPNSASKSLPVFVGWRFRFISDLVEMDSVRDWLNQNQKKLKVTMSDAFDACYSAFGRYKAKDDKYFYKGYPGKLGTERIGNMESPEVGSGPTRRNSQPPNVDPVSSLGGE